MILTGSSNTELEQFAPALNRLRQGLMAGSHTIVLEAHRELYLQEGPVAEAIVEQLRRIDLVELERPEVISVAAGLATLLHDIDEAKSRKFLNAALKGPCNPAISSAFRSLLRYSESDYEKTCIGTLEILEHRSIASGYRATRHVCDWLGNVPADDLDHISRIYIVRDDVYPEIHGYYLPFLSVIILTWINQFGPRNPLTRMSRLMHEHTLYHEIGHHACGHTEGGQVPEQEDEANEYARRLLGAAHPNLARTAKFIRMLRGEKPSSSEC